jgi:SAM-dependent methyltransferase
MSTTEKITEGRMAPGSPELRAFYRDRTGWRHSGEERMRFEAATRLAAVTAGARVLDVGARDGGLKGYLPAGVTYQGVEIAPEFAAPDILVHDVSGGLPFPDASFDFAFCIEVMEHLPNPFLAMSEMRRVLAPRGILVVSVPNPYHAKELIWNLFRIPDRQGHLYSWTRQTMTRFGEMVGFERVGFTGTYLHPPIPMFALLARSIVYRFQKTG